MEGCGARFSRKVLGTPRTGYAIVTTQNETSLKLAVCIEHNTEALQECAFELRRFQERNDS
jgi:hypothetical protein